MASHKRMVELALLASCLCLISPLSQAQTFTTIYSFESGNGALPLTSLLYKNGILYGTTASGAEANGSADAGEGSIFGVSATSHSETLLYSFETEGGGAYPEAPLVAYGGLLYGTTSSGGEYERGTVFAIDPTTNTEQVVYSFRGQPDGDTPNSGLVVVGGELYGATVFGGATNGGTIFRIDPSSGTESIVNNFQGSIDGEGPVSGLLYQNGILYGTTTTKTATCNPPGCSSIFSFNITTGATTTIYEFTARSASGGPASGLISDGTFLYGTTPLGNDGGFGQVFKFNPRSGKLKVLHSFLSSGDGSLPSGGLVLLNRELYGTTKQGGANNDGTIFKVNALTGEEAVLHSFSGAADGNYPQASLIRVGKVLYGTTSLGGPSAWGTIFSFVP